MRPRSLAPYTRRLASLSWNELLVWQWLFHSVSVHVVVSKLSSVGGSLSMDCVGQMTLVAAIAM